MSENRLQEVLEGRRLVSEADIISVVSTTALHSLLGQGEGYWKDAEHTSVSPQTILAAGTGVLSIDGLHANTSLTQLNSLPATTWSSNKINPEVSGESYDMRIDLTVERSSSVTGQYVQLQIDIGSGSEVIILERRIDLFKQAGEPQRTSIGVPIFCRDTFFANGGRILLKPSENVGIYGKAIFLRRNYRP